MHQARQYFSLCSTATIPQLKKDVNKVFALGGFDNGKALN